MPEVMEKPVQEQTPADMSQPVDPSELDGSMEAEEPLSAQILRRVHEDKRLLMEEYAEMCGMLEHPPVRRFMERELMGHEKGLSMIEELFAAHHQGLSPLDGGDTGEFALEEEVPTDGKDMGMEEQTESDSNPGAGQDMPGSDYKDQEPSPDEAAKATMNPTKNRKSLPNQRHKSMCSGCQKSPCACSKSIGLFDKDKGMLLKRMHEVLTDLGKTSTANFGTPHLQKAYHYKELMKKAFPEMEEDKLGSHAGKIQDIYNWFNEVANNGHMDFGMKEQAEAQQLAGHCQSILEDLGGAHHSPDAANYVDEEVNVNEPNQPGISPGTQEQKSNPKMVGQNQNGKQGQKSLPVYLVDQANRLDQLNEVLENLTKVL